MGIRSPRLPPTHVTKAWYEAKRFTGFGLALFCTAMAGPAQCSILFGDVLTPVIRLPVFHFDEAEPAKPRRKRKTYEEQIREYVATLNEDALRELLLEAVERDLTLRDKLLFAARAASASDLPSMKTAVRQATRLSRPLDWREASAHGDGLMSLAAMLRQRLAGPHAAQVVELTELAIGGEKFRTD
jgi:hypothetical protein